MNAPTVQPSSPPIRLMLIDDEEILRRSLRLLIESEADMRVVSEVADCADALAAVSMLQPDLILLDLHLEHQNGAACLAQLQVACPTTRVLMLAAMYDETLYLRAIRHGACGVVSKPQAVRELAPAIRTVHAGRIWLDPQLRD
jgi:DNA-binding NarL/FixJ family response regulator